MRERFLKNSTICSDDQLVTTEASIVALKRMSDYADLFYCRLKCFSAECWSVFCERPRHCVSTKPIQLGKVEVFH